jgi:hypothetical protein
VDLVEGLTPFEAEKEAAYGVGAGNVGAPTTLDSFAPTIEMKKDRKRLMLVHLDRLEPSLGATQDVQP